MPQTTFDDIRKKQTLEQLTDKQKRIIRLLAAGQTQSSIAKVMRVSRSSVNQSVTFFEKNNLVKKQIGTNYNVLYEVSPQLQRRVGGDVTEPLTPYRVHNIAAHYKIQQQNHPVSEDKRSGYTKQWKMRGGIRYAYQFWGKAGEPNITVTVHPRSIVIRVDAGQKIIATTAEEAEHRGFQYLANVRQKFIDCQRKFGVILEIETTGRKIGKAHAGLAFREGGPLDSETRIPGTWVDGSATKELGPGYKEFEMHTDHSLLTPLEKGVLAIAGVSDMIRDTINPIGADVLQVKAMMQGEITMQRQYEQMMKFMTAAMTEIQTLRKEVQELKAAH